MKKKTKSKPFVITLVHPTGAHCVVLVNSETMMGALNKLRDDKERMCHFSELRISQVEEVIT